MCECVCVCVVVYVCCSISVTRRTNAFVRFFRVLEETERRRDRETERQRDRETERQRDRETERQRERQLPLLYASMYLRFPDTHVHGETRLI
jgi:hypothetical protein